MKAIFVIVAFLFFWEAYRMKIIPTTRESNLITRIFLVALGIGLIVLVNFAKVLIQMATMQPMMFETNCR